MANPSYLALTVMNGQILFSGQLATTASTAVYTVPTGKTVKIASGAVCNTSGSTTSVTDGVLNSTNVVTSATANFTSVDVGKTITGTGIPAGATIQSRTDAATIVISAAATATATGVALSWSRPAATVAVNVALHKVGDVADGTHRVVSAYSLLAGDTLTLRDYLVGVMLAEGESVVVSAGTANVVDVVLTGAVSA